MLKLYKKIHPVLVIFLLVVCLLPVMYLGRYNHPTGDDYYYGVKTHLKWEETGKILPVLAEAAKGVQKTYFEWQGTYSAMFLMYLSPNVFSHEGYRWVTTVLLFLLTVSIFYLCKNVYGLCLNGDGRLWSAMALVLTILSVETVPSQGETFFWYNGSMYYTGFLAVTFLFFGLLIRVLKGKSKIGVGILPIMALFLAGGNYVSLLPSMIIVFLIMVYYLVLNRKMVVTKIITAKANDGKMGSAKSDSNLKKAKYMAGLLACMVIGLGISAAAPGNAIRQSTTGSNSAVVAVLKSLRQGFFFARAWINPWWILGALIVLPFLIAHYYRNFANYRHPVLVCLFVYGIFCSMVCPTFYAMNSTGPARAVAIVYYGFLFTTFFCLYYAGGAVFRLITIRTNWVEDFLYHKGKRALWLVGYLAVGAVMVLLIVVSGKGARVTTLRAVKLLQNGEAAAYQAEFEKRMEILEDDTIQEVVFLPYEHMADMVYVGDFEMDPESTTNKAVAKYFKKQSVCTNYLAMNQ